MGMYDTFWIMAKCPFCGKLISNFQTKALDCLLNEYFEGDIFISEFIEIKNGKIKEVYTNCEDKNCQGYNKLIYGEIIIEDSIIMGVSNLR